MCRRNARQDLRNVIIFRGRRGLFLFSALKKLRSSYSVIFFNNLQRFFVTKYSVIVNRFLLQDSTHLKKKIKDIFFDTLDYQHFSLVGRCLPTPEEWPVCRQVYWQPMVQGQGGEGFVHRRQRSLHRLRKPGWSPQNKGRIVQYFSGTGDSRIVLLPLDGVVCLGCQLAK